MAIILEWRSQICFLRVLICCATLSDPKCGIFPVNMIFLFDQLWKNMIEKHRAICELNSFSFFSQVGIFLKHKLM